MVVLLSEKYMQVWKIYECGNIYKTENLFKKKAAEYASVLTKTEAKNSHMASVLTITEAKRSAKIWIKKKIFFTYGLGPIWTEAENCVYGTGFKTTEA